MSVDLHNYAKPIWRGDNFRWLREYDRLWDGDKLKYGYLEFVGGDGKHMFHLLEQHLVDYRQFIGLDHEFAVIFKHRYGGVPWYSVMCPRGEGYLTAETIAGLDAAGRRAKGLVRPTAVFNFDDTTSVDSEWGSTTDQLRRLVSKTLEQTGGVCAVLLNYTVDRGLKEKRSADTFLRHAQRVAKTFGRWGVRVEDLLGSKCKYLGPLAETSTLGVFGGYQLYRSEGRPNRMATIRLQWQRSDKAIVWRC